MQQPSTPTAQPSLGGGRDSRLADVIAAFTTETHVRDLPRQAIDAAKRSILDTIAVTVAGTRSRAGRAVIAALAEGGSGPASVMGTTFRTHPTVAALINGTLAHALDFDDVWADDDGVVAWRGHPSVCVLPAVLAAGEAHGCDGATALLSYVIGVEIAGKLGTAFGPQLGRAGWHPTPVLGTLGTAAAVARVLGLERERVTTMLGLAATETFGLVQNFGTDTKPFHAGHAAQCGLQAALLARHGFTANASAVDACLRVHSGPDEATALAALGTLGQVYDLIAPGLSIKKYPCCRFAHLSLDATFTLLASERVDPNALENYTVRIQPGADDALIYRDPQTGLEGKFSMEYVHAAALLDGQLTLASFSDEMVQRPAIRSLMHRVRTEYRPEPGAEVVARTSAGEYRAAARVVRGDPANPLSWEELLRKAHDCLEDVLSADRAAQIVAGVAELERLADVRQLTDLLGSETRPVETLTPG